MWKRWNSRRLLEVAVLGIVVMFLVIVPLVVTLVVSLWDYAWYAIIPDFTVLDYQEIVEDAIRGYLICA